uniref:Uncharacterized protein n=1 Tax=Anguilla anguilla TaxID=7936 RepID=A0A0E9UID5_ANGAN
MEQEQQLCESHKT